MIPDRAPVWNLRKEPPPHFHEYQTLTEEEWDDEYDKSWIERRHRH